MIRKGMGAIALVAFLWSCDSGPDCTKTVQQSDLDGVNAAQLAIDNAIIDDYIIASNLGPVLEVNGIKYIMNKQGSGVTPCIENNVTVSYKGRLLSNGSVFDSSPLSGVTFQLNRLILGWRLSFPSFSKGTAATIFIPSGYGYGPEGLGPVPPNANLIFDIELLNVR